MSVDILESKKLQARLKLEGILVTLDWVSACLDFILNDDGHIPRERWLLTVQEQWLSADVAIEGIMEKPVLPRNINEMAKTELSGKILLQVNYAVDIGNPSYGQLQKLYKVNTENSRVSAESGENTQSGYQPTQGKFVASWEPKSSRMLQLTLTDGFTTVQAIEHEPIAVFPDVVTPGLKIQLLKPVICRRGKIFLTKNSVRILGGEVEDLQEKFSTEKILCQRIGRVNFAPVQQDLRDNTVVPHNIQPLQHNNHTVQINNPLVQPNNHTVQHINHTVQPNNHTVQQNNHPVQHNNRPVQQNNQPMQQNNGRFEQGYPKEEEDLWEDEEGFPCLEVGEEFPCLEDDDELLLLQSAVEMERAVCVSDNSEQARKRPPCSDDQQRKKVAKICPYKQDPDRNTPERKHLLQSTIHSFIQPKPEPPCRTSEAGDKLPKVESDFGDLDGDLDVFDAVEIPEACPQPTVISQEPFVYLCNLKQEIAKTPTRRFFVTIKAVSTTLASKMKISKTPTGPHWNISVILNDGSDFIEAAISPGLLDNELGPAADYLSRDPLHKQRFKVFSQKLANLSCLLKLRCNGAGSLPVIEAMEEISNLHFAKLRRRRIT